jgi:hypothetical protein
VTEAGPAIPARWLGAAIGAATGPAVGFGQAWGRTGDGRAWVWVFTRDGERSGEIGPGFGSLFGFSVGLVGGAFVAFPMGSAIGALGGVVAGASAVLAARWGARTLRRGAAWAAGLGSVVGASAALVVLAIWM